MKKILAIAMVLALMVSCVVTVSATTPEVTATVATVMGPFSEGDEIAIPITITEWANAYAIIDITYPEFDEELLTLDAMEASTTDFGGALTAFGPNGYALVASPSSDRAAKKVDGGEICIMYFYALQDINTPVTVSVEVSASGYTVGEEDNWLENRALVVETVNGGIDIEVPPHDCTPGNDIQYDETDHWYNCTTVGCGNQLNKAPHEGGEATCTARAVCTVCGASYGELDATNHGDSELRNEVAGDCGNDGYTGDTYCLDCGEMIEEGEVIPATGNHTGGTATCKAQAVCTVCGDAYGDLDADNHTGDTELREEAPADCANDGYTGDTYCLDCGVMLEQGEVIPSTGEHAGGTATCCAKAICGGCGQEYGELDATNHVGGTEVSGYEPATCCEDGYTGDTYCLGCDALIEQGEVIPATGEHASTGDYEYDEDNHWKVCDTVGCGALVGEGAHEGGEATCVAKAECEICGAEYGDLDADNHKGETEVRGYEPATCCEDGYTGDTYCLDCGEMIEEGEVIPATGEHASTGDYEYDEDNHWRVCDTVGCGALVDEGAHQGGEATCVAKAECEICGAEYGDEDPDNHFGGEATCNKKAVCEGCGEEYGDFDATNHKNTEVRDGDTWCTDCNTMIEEGEPTPPTPTDPTIPGGPLGDASAVGVAGVVCLTAAAAAFVLTKKRG